VANLCALYSLIVCAGWIMLTECKIIYNAGRNWYGFNTTACTTTGYIRITELLCFGRHVLCALRFTGDDDECLGSTEMLFT